MLIKYFFAVCFAAAIAIIIVKAVKAVVRILNSDCDDGLRLTENDVRDIEEVVNYLWNDEERHFTECGCPERHIFLTLKRLDQLVNRRR